MANAHASSSRRPIANGRTNGAIARPSQDDQVQANGAPVPDGEDGSEHEDGSEEEEEGWTIDTFKSRPLEKSNAAMLEVCTLSHHLHSDLDVWTDSNVGRQLQGGHQEA